LLQTSDDAGRLLPEFSPKSSFFLNLPSSLLPFLLPQTAALPEYPVSNTPHRPWVDITCASSSRPLAVLTSWLASSWAADCLNGVYFVLFWIVSHPYSCTFCCLGCHGPRRLPSSAFKAPTLPSTSLKQWTKIHLFFTQSTTPPLAYGRDCLDSAVPASPVLAATSASPYFSGRIPNASVRRIPNSRPLLQSKCPYCTLGCKSQAGLSQHLRQSDKCPYARHVQKHGGTHADYMLMQQTDESRSSSNAAAGGRGGTPTRRLTSV
jgi:hypothetical protein